MTLTAETSHNTDKPARQLDALIIGTGVAGLYQLHQLRELGLDVQAYDVAADVGGTWFWNRYPGARFDSEAYIYQYLFDEDLYKNWSWSKRFPDQPEIERWLHYITDSLDLRKRITFNTRIDTARYDEEHGRWTVLTDTGEVIDTQFLITCCGMLSAPMENILPGQETFSGEVVHTSRYPKEGIDLQGKRVGVVGVGATGIQVIQTIASEVGRLTVFARTPQYMLPMKNPAYSQDDVTAYKDRFEEFQATLPYTFSGFEYNFEEPWGDLSAAQRLTRLEEIYENGSLELWIGSFSELFFDEAISEEISDFVRDKMRARLKDPQLIETLVPTDYGFGTYRVPLESGYLETYLRDNVELVNARTNPIAKIVPEGVELSDGTVHELDVLILATGFDAGTGALTRMNIIGRDDRTIAGDWGADIRTTMGLMVHGYPNMLTTAVPLAPSAALCNMATCLQQQTEWITDCIRHMRAHDKSVIEPTKEGEDAWVDHHDETANATLVPRTNSWYMGGNVPGKPRRLLSYIGGVGQYRELCDNEVSSGYPSFSIT